MIDQLQKAISHAAAITVALLKARAAHNPAQLDLFGNADPHHVGYTRTNRSGTSSIIAAKNPRPPDVPLARPKGTTVFINGDAARHTGRTENMHGGHFHEIEMLEGHQKGEMKWTAHPPKYSDPVPDPTPMPTPEPSPTPAFVKPDKRSALAVQAALRSSDFGYTEAGGNGRTAVDPGGNLTVYDSYYYGGNDRHDSLKKRWSPDGDMHNWFAEQGYDIRVTGSGKNTTSKVFKTPRGSSTKGGDVWVTLAVMPTTAPAPKPVPAAVATTKDEAWANGTRAGILGHGANKNPHHSGDLSNAWGRGQQNGLTERYDADATARNTKNYDTILASARKNQHAKAHEIATKLVEVAKEYGMHDAGVYVQAWPGGKPRVQITTNEDKYEPEQRHIKFNRDHYDIKQRVGGDFEQSAWSSYSPNNEVKVYQRGEHDTLPDERAAQAKEREERNRRAGI
jgi:hypothetical protein